MEQQFTHLDGKRVRLKYKSEFMENYVAESNVDLGQDIKVIATSDDKVLVFLINGRSELTLVTRTDQEGDAWERLRISPEGSKVTAFNILYNEAGNTLRIAYAAKTDQGNALQLSAHINLSKVSPQDIFKGIVFQPHQLADKQRTLHSISLSSSNVLFSSDKPKTDARYHLIDQSGTLSDYIFPENADRVLQISLGIWGNTQGVFVLYELQKSRTMLYMALAADGNGEILQQRFSTTYKPNYFFLLKNTGTDDQLFTAGAGITRFKKYKAKGEQLCDPLFDFSKIDVSEENGEISIWATDLKSRELRLLRTQKEGGWTAPVSMHQDTDTFASVRGPYLSNHLFLFDQSKNGRLTELWQDAVSGRWHEHLLGISDLSSSRLINTYTLDLYFEKHDLEESIQEKISLTAKASTFIYLNDIKYQLKAGAPLEFPFAEYVNIMCPLDSLVFPEIEISSRLFEKDLIINPGHPVSTTLAEKIRSADDLRKAVKQNGELLVPASTDAALLKEAASLTTTLTGNNNIQPAFAMQKDLELGLWHNISESLQDLLFSIKKGFAAAQDFIVEKAKSGWRFILKIGGTIYNWVGDTLNDIFSFLERVWEKIGVVFKDIVDYLSFLFSWKDIIETKDALKLTANMAIDGLKPGINVLRNMVVAQVKDWRQRAKLALRNVGAPDYTVNDLPKEKVNGQNDKLDSRTNWVGSKQQVLFSTKASSSNGLDRDALSEMDTASQDPVMTRLANLLKKFLSSEITLGQLIKEFAEIMLDVAFDLIEEVVNGVFDMIITSIDLIKRLLNAEIQIPLLSAIYRKISDAELSILDFCCLLGAIPMTIGYKIAFGEAPFANLSKERFAELNLQHFNLIPTKA